MNYIKQLCFVLIWIVMNIVKESQGYLDLAGALYRVPYPQYYFKPYMNDVFIFPWINRDFRNFDNLVNRENYVYNDLYPRPDNTIFDGYADINDNCEEDEEQSNTILPNFPTQATPIVTRNTVPWDNTRISQSQWNRLKIIENKEFLLRLIRQKLVKLNEHSVRNTLTRNNNMHNEQNANRDSTVAYEQNRKNSNSEVRYTALSTMIGNVFCAWCNSQSGQVKRNCLRLCFSQMLTNMTQSANSDD